MRQPVIWNPAWWVLLLLTIFLAMLLSGFALIQYIRYQQKEDMKQFILDNRERMKQK